MTFNYAVCSIDIIYFINDDTLTVSKIGKWRNTRKYTSIADSTSISVQ